MRKRCPAERTNVVNIGASWNKYGFVISLLSTVLNDSRGFKDFLTTWSKFCGWRMSSQKWNAVSARRTSLVADRDRCFWTMGNDGAGGVVSRVAEWDRISRLGVVTGEREGILGENGKSGRWAGVLCWGGIIWAGLSGRVIFFSPFGWGKDGVWDCVCVSVWVAFLYFSPLLQLLSPHYPYAVLNSWNNPYLHLFLYFL